MTVRLDTDNAGLVTVAPSTTPLVIDRREATKGQGFAVDVGVGAVIDRWEVGFGANGIANRIDWNGVTRTRYALGSLFSGEHHIHRDADSPGSRCACGAAGRLPRERFVSHRLWSAAVQAGHGFGGASFHGGSSGGSIGSSCAPERATPSRHGTPRAEWFRSQPPRVAGRCRLRHRREHRTEAPDGDRGIRPSITSSESRPTLTVWILPILTVARPSAA